MFDTASSVGERVLELNDPAQGHNLGVIKKVTSINTLKSNTLKPNVLKINICTSFAILVR